eukprot:s791_g2.t1
MWSVVVQAQLLPDVVTFNAASSACGRVSEWQRWGLKLGKTAKTHRLRVGYVGEFVEMNEDWQLEATVISYGAVFDGNVKPAPPPEAPAPALTTQEITAYHNASAGVDYAWCLDGYHLIGTAAVRRSQERT